MMTMNRVATAAAAMVNNKNNSAAMVMMMMRMMSQSSWRTGVTPCSTMMMMRSGSEAGEAGVAARTMSSTSERRD